MCSSTRSVKGQTETRERSWPRAPPVDLALKFVIFQSNVASRKMYLMPDLKGNLTFNTKKKKKKIEYNFR